MQFEPWIVERVKARQGVLHPYDTLDATTTAFVVVDLQKYYTQPGFQGECAPARGIFDNVNKLATVMRARGGKVVWIKTNADGADQFWSHHHRHMLTPERSARRLLELSASHEGFEMPDTLDVQENDLTVVKRCYSALAPGASELDAVLKAHGIRTVLIGGTVTNVCCESTARDAMMLDYATIMVDDALAAVTPYEHEHSLNNWMLFFGDVLTVDEVVERLR